MGASDHSQLSPLQVRLEAAFIEHGDDKRCPDRNHFLSVKCIDNTEKQRDMDGSTAFSILRLPTTGWDNKERPAYSKPEIG